MEEANRRKTYVASLSVVSNTTLVLLKLVVGVLIGSVSVISEAIHSGVDLVAALIALFAVRTAGKPEDEDHPFGHHKIENISGTVEALLIFAAAAWIIYEAIHKIKNPAPLDAALWGVGVMLISTIVNVFVSQMLFVVGRETESIALQADAWHLRTDVYTSAGVMFGLGAIWVGEKLFPGIDLRWLDSAGAIAVALLITKTAWDLTLHAGRDLMDASLPAEEEALIREHVVRLSPLVKGFHRLRTRKAGSKRFVQFHLLVNADMTVDESHRLNDQIVDSIKEHFPHCNISIHIEPCDGNCENECAGCLLSTDERERIRREASSKS